MPHYFRWGSRRSIISAWPSHNKAGRFHLLVDPCQSWTAWAALPVLWRHIHRFLFSYRRAWAETISVTKSAVFLAIGGTADPSPPWEPGTLPSIISQKSRVTPAFGHQPNVAGRSTFGFFHVPGGETFSPSTYLLVSVFDRYRRGDIWNTSANLARRPFQKFHHRRNLYTFSIFGCIPAFMSAFLTIFATKPKTIITQSRLSGNITAGYFK